MNEKKPLHSFAERRGSGEGWWSGGGGGGGGEGGGGVAMSPPAHVCAREVVVEVEEDAKVVAGNVPVV